MESGAIWYSTLHRGQDCQRAPTPFGFSRTNRRIVGAYTSYPGLSWSIGTEIPTPLVIFSVSVRTALGASAYSLSHAGPDYLRVSVNTLLHPSLVCPELARLCQTPRIPLVRLELPTTRRIHRREVRICDDDLHSHRFKMSYSETPTASASTALWKSPATTPSARSPSQSSTTDSAEEAHFLGFTHPR